MKLLTIIAFLAMGLPRLLAGEEKAIPFEDIFIGVETAPRLDWWDRSPQIMVKLTVARNREAEVDVVSIDMSCFKFANKRSMTQQDLEVFLEIGEAAAKGLVWTEEVVTRTRHGEFKTVYEAAKIGNKRSVIRMSRGNETVEFQPKEVERVRRAVNEAKIGKIWYEKLFTADELPEPLPEARPPRSTGIYLRSGVGLVWGGAIGYGIGISCESMFSSNKHSYEVRHSLCFSDGRVVTSTNEWKGTILEKMVLAQKAAETGERFVFESEPLHGTSYTVRSNIETKEADLLFKPKRWPGNRVPVEGHFGAKELQEIQRLIEVAEARKKWFEENESLFFERMP